ncbi:MAG: helix-turn-helix domain-containing protein [Chloroflexi bacterium]|nr:helix-turn-helix domain-containing protein [Chloroflexota bacterium]
MQSTRKRILEILKEHGQATVEVLGETLSLTTVTVRHHLDVLRSEGLIEEPVVKHRSTPGRPQYVYSLAPRAAEHFPKNFDGLSNRLLESMRASLDPDRINLIFDDVAGRFAAEAPPPLPGETPEQGLDRIVTFLDEKGYVARWERVPEGFLLHTTNCPYEGSAAGHPELCAMDMRLMTALLNVEPERMGRVVEGCGSCSYLIREALEFPRPVSD